MSPLADPPARGYADFQRVDNWDSPTLYGHLAVVGGPAESSGVLDVSRYAYLGGIDTPNGGPMTLFAQWYTDQAASILAGQREIALDPAIANQAQYRLANLGPFAVLTWNLIAGGAFAHGVELFGTNRVHPLELIPVDPTLYSNNAVSIVASGALTAYPTDYYAGPVAIRISLSQAYRLDLQALTFTGSYVAMGEWSGTAGQNQMISALVPPGAWRLVLTNLSATTTGTGTLQVVYSNTGAA